MLERQTQLFGIPIYTTIMTPFGAPNNTIG